MARQQHGAAFRLHLADAVLEHGLHERVESRRRLVEDEQLRARSERRDETDLLAVPLRVRARLLRRVELEPLEQLVAPARVEVAAQPPEQVDHLAAAQLRPQRDVAGYVREPSVQRDRVAPRVAAEEHGPSGVDAEQTEQHADGGGLARAVRPEEAVHLAGPHLEVEAVERPRRPERLDHSGHHDRVGHGASLTFAMRAVAPVRSGRGAPPGRVNEQVHAEDQDPKREQQLRPCERLDSDEQHDTDQPSHEREPAGKDAQAMADRRGDDRKGAGHPHRVDRDDLERGVPAETPEVGRDPRRATPCGPEEPAGDRAGHEEHRDEQQARSEEHGGEEPVLGRADPIPYCTDEPQEREAGVRDEIERDHDGPVPCRIVEPRPRVVGIGGDGDADEDQGGAEKERERDAGDRGRAGVRRTARVISSVPVSTPCSMMRHSISRRRDGT